MFLLLCINYLNATNYNTSNKTDHSFPHKKSIVTVSAEKPNIISFSEKFVEAGDNLIIYGYNFNADPFINKVWIGGIEAAINGGSESELEVTVPFGAKSQAEVIVLNLDNQLMGSSLNTAVPYLNIIFPEGVLVPGQTFIEDEILNLGFSAESVTISDLNADGLNDLIFTKDAEIGIAYRRADNSGFSGAEYIPTNRFYDKIVTADINNDGLLDICSIDFFEDQLVVIYRESDNSGFSVQEQYSIVARYTDIQVHDMNQDGLNDLIITGTNQFAILYRNSTNDGFEEPVSYGLGPYVVRLTIADFNQDNKLDVAVTQEERNNNLSIFLQNSSDNDFTLDARYSAGEYPTGILHADFNNDGFIDIMTLNIDDNELTILEGSSEGTFFVKDRIPTPDFPYLPNAADLDGNGVIDLALLSLTNETLSIFIGDGNFSFSEEIVEPTGLTPRWLAVGDLNNDGRSDIAVNNTGEEYIGFHHFDEPPFNIISADPALNTNNIETEQHFIIEFNKNIDPATVNKNSVLIRGSISGKKAFADYTIENNKIIVDPYPTGIDFIAGEKVTVTVTDSIESIDGEILDETGSATYTVKSGLAPAEFVNPEDITGGGPNRGFAAGDFNNDFIPDLAVLKSDLVNVFQGDGDGTFTFNTFVNLGSSPNDILIKDFNNDGIDDIVISDNVDNNIAVLFNGGGNYQIPLGVNEPSEINSADFNNDGWLDIAVTFDNTNRFRIYSGQDDGTFVLWDEYISGSTYVNQIATADINNDGYLDLVVSQGGTDNIEIFIQVDGDFIPNQFFPNETAITTISELQLSDLNNDNFVDLIYTDDDGSSLFIHLSRLDGTFGSRISYNMSSSPSSFAINDFNGDGLQDIAVTILQQDKLDLFLGNGDGTLQAPRDFLSGNDPFKILALPIDSDSDIDILTLNGSGTRVKILLNEATPEIILNQVNVPSLSISRGSLDQVIYKFTANVAKGNTILESLSLTTSGNYLNTDIGANGFKLYHNTLDEFTTATELGSVNTSTGNGETINFNTIDETLTIGSNNYFWIAVDISPTAFLGNTISINQTWFTNIVFSEGNKTGTDPIGAGNTSTIVALGKPEPSNHASNFVATQSGPDGMDISWTDAVGGQLPDHYLLIGRRSSSLFPIITDSDPIANDTDWSDGIITLNVTHDGGPKSIPLIGLVEGESYFFQLYPYTNTGTDINYKTDNVPTTSETISNNLIDQATGLNFTAVNSTSITLDWINGTGTSRIVIVSSGDSVEGVPEDINTYVADANFGDGDVIGVNDYVVYNGTGNTVTVTGLDPATQYTFKVFESYAPIGLDLYVKSSNPTNPASQFTLANEPIQQPENLSFTSTSTTSTIINYTAPILIPDGYIILRSVVSTSTPIDGVEYTVGQTIGPSTVIYNGTGLSFNDTGLTPGTTYKYEVFSYNGSGESIDYLQTGPLTGSVILPANQPGAQANNILFTSLNSNSLKINWVNGNGTNRIVIMKASTPVDALPIDQTTYNPNTIFGNGDEIGSGNFVVYNGEGNNVVVNGLSPETGYHVQVFEFNGNIGAENYLTNTSFQNPFFRETLPVLIDQITISNPSPTGPISEGLHITSNTNPGDYLQDPLDEITWGHDGGDTTITNSQLQGTISNRWSRTWYIAKADQFNTNGSLKLTFDLSDAGFSGSLSRNFNYFLIYSPDKFQNFSIIKYFGAYKPTADDRIEFILNEASLPEGYYTLGMTDASPIAENALYFDGVSDHVEISDEIPVPGNLTLEAWVKLDDITGRHPIVSKGINDANQSFLLMIDDGDLLFDWGDNTAKINGNRTLEAGKWYHIAAVINNTNTTANIYLNGLKVAETTTAPIHTDMNAPVYIGRTGSDYLNGNIDELRIWRKAKNGAEIRADSYRHINGNETDLVAYYRFDQFNSTILPDLSQNSFTGFLIGPDWVSSQAMIPAIINYNSGIGGGTIKQGKDDEVIYKLSLTSTQTDAFLEGIKFPTSGTYDNNDIEDLKLFLSVDDSFNIETDILLDSIPAPTSGNIAEFNNFDTVPWLTKDSTYYLFVTVDIEGDATLGNSLGIDAPLPTDFTTNTGSIIPNIVTNGGQYIIISPYVVTSTGNRGKGTLHWAIKNSNRSNNETISFNIPGPGPWIITLDSALAAITSTAIIDATTQPNWGALNRITINGQNSIDNGIIIQAPNVEIFGLTLSGFNTGIFIDGQDQDRFMIGDIGKGNIISNCTTGILVFGADDGFISGNRIGTNPEGSMSNPNTLYGIHLQGDATGGATNIIIGGNQAGEGNLISGNTEANIFIENSSDNYIERNVIGSNLLLNDKIGGKKGIWIDPLSMNNIIGGVTINERNIIGGNAEYGVFIEGNANEVYKNIIGSDVTLSNDLGNGLAGIYITGSDNRIGGSVIEEGNTLLFNEGAITVAGDTAIDNNLRLNSIYCNTSGIVLLNNSNDQISAPLMSTANATTITGTSDPNFTIDIYTDSLDACASGQGKVYLGTATADAAGDWSFSGSFVENHEITAQATDATGNSSIFSAPIVVDITTPDAPNLLSISEDTGDPTDGITSDASIILIGTAETNSTVSIFINGVLDGTTIADNLGDFNYDLTASPFLDGIYDLTATATDIAGNVGPLSNVYKLTVNTNIPVKPNIIGISEDTDIPNDRVTEDNTLIFTGTADVNVTIAVSLNNNFIGNTTSDGIGNWNFDYTGTPLTEGEYEITAIATNNAGTNSTISDVFSFTIVTTPVIQANNINATGIGTNAATFDWSSGSGNGELLVIFDANDPITVPNNNTTYLADPDFALAPGLGSGKAVYVGNANNISIEGLQPASSYKAVVFSYNDIGAYIAYQTDTASNVLFFETLALEPTDDPSGLILTEVQEDTLNFSFLPSLQNDDGYLVVRRQTAPELPIDGTSYTVNDMLGAQLVSFVGPNVSFTQTGLQPLTTYTFDIYAYNGSGTNINYLQSPALTVEVNTPDFQPLDQAENLQLLALNSSTIEGNFDPAPSGADGYLVLYTDQTGLPLTISDGVSYFEGESFDGWTVLQIGNMTTFTAENLDINTNYTFTVMAFNGSGNTINYRIQDRLTGSAFTGNNAPIAIGLDNRTFTELAPIGTLVGLLNTTDPDINDIHTYSLVNNASTTDSTAFRIVGNRIEVNKTLYYIDNGPFQISVASSDGQGGIFLQNFTIQIQELPLAESDSLSVLALYNDLDPRPIFDTNDPVKTWEGVSVRGGKVTGLDMSSKGIDSFSISQVLNLDALDTLYINDNDLTFQYLEPFVGVVQNFTYLPQFSSNATDTLIAYSNRSFAISIEENTTNETYQWYKDDVVLQGENQSQISFITPSKINEGIYRCEINSTIITDLTLYSKYFYLKVVNVLNEQDSLSMLSVLQDLNIEQGIFDVNEPASSWPGVVEENNRIVEINLSSAGLTGNINSAIGNLTELRRIDLFNNQLEGEVPEEIGGLINLTYLDLDKNQLEGDVPELLGNLVKLTTLWLSRNNFTSIPQSIGNLKELQYLFLQENNFSSLPGSLGELDKLIKLDISNNELIAFIDDPSGLTSLEELDLSNNKIETISNLFGALSKLRLLDLSNNRLKALPVDFNLLGNLEQLFVYNNFLTFEDIEPLDLAGTAYQVYYAPQKKIDLSEDVLLTTGTTYNLDFVTGGSDNFYVWLKDGISFDTTSTGILEIPNLSLIDTGTYSAKVYSNIVTDLEIFQKDLNVFVTCNSFPSVDLSTVYDTTVCDGKNIYIELTTDEVEGGTYNWRKDGQRLLLANNEKYIAFETGTYSLIVTDTNGCTAISNEIGISTVATPNVTINMIDSTTMVAQTDTENGFYKWYLNGQIIEGANDSTLSVSGSGVYKASVENGFSCEGFSEDRSFVITSLKNEKVSQEIKLYPNPVIDKLFLQSPVNSGASKAEIYNVTGELISDYNLDLKQIQEIDISDLAGGVYTIIIYTKNGKAAKRFVKI